MLAPVITCLASSPPISCGSNTHGPDNAPLCVNVVLNTSRVGALTLVNTTSVNTSAIVAPPATVEARGSFWFSVHDGEYWPPNAGIKNWEYTATYTGPCIASFCKTGQVYQILVSISLEGSFDLVVAVGKGLAYGGSWVNDPFVATAVISDDDALQATAAPAAPVVWATGAPPALPFGTAPQFRAHVHEHSASPLCTDPACTYYNGTRAIDVAAARRHDVGVSSFDGTFFQDALWLCANATPVQYVWTNTSVQCSVQPPTVGFCNDPGPELTVPAAADYKGLEQGINGVAAHHWSFFFPLFSSVVNAWTAAAPHNALIRFTGARVTTDYTHVAVGPPGDEAFQPNKHCK